MNDTDILSQIKGLTADSRMVRRGWLFAALQGKIADGRLFIQDALINGASIILAPEGTELPDGADVTLITDPDQAIPVLNVRTGARGLAFGNSSLSSGTLELRYMDAHVDMAAGDLLTTSGVDGIYPPGLPVGRVLKIERRADSAFARITAQPIARLDGSLQVLVLQPLAGQVPTRPDAPAEPGRSSKGAQP